MSALTWTAFAAAAAAGAVLRFLVDRRLAEPRSGRFPWGTVVVNASGSLLAGVVTRLALWHGLPATLGLVLTTGFCGAYTTFSTFAFETVRLFEAGALQQAAGNVAGTVLACALTAVAGLALASI